MPSPAGASGNPPGTRSAHRQDGDPPASVFLVEDHAALREAAELLLASEGHEVVGSSGDARIAYSRIHGLKPDVAVVDIHLSGESGLDLTRRLAASETATRVLVYTGSEDYDLLAEALECGARGVALKTGSAGELVTAIGAVAAGDTYLDPRISARMLERARDGRAAVLTPRQREVLELVTRGMTGDAIANALFLSPDTVRTHVRNAMEKLGAHTRAHAIALAAQRREIDLDGALSAGDPRPGPPA